MQRNGGSMLQAAILATADPGRAKLSEVSLFAVPDPAAKTIKKHDLITIVVHEEGQNSSTGDSSLSKEADFDAKMADFVQLNLAQMQLKGYSPSVAPELNLQATRDFKGDAAIDRADIVTDRITAEVVDVKPNNTLVLQARKRVKTDDEEQEILLSGICRVEDVTADNTILSNQCFDLSIEKKNSGTVRETTKRGFFPKLLDLIDPF
jgi:flagellar L-ring protein precursor FlgH